MVMGTSISSLKNKINYYAIYNRNTKPSNIHGIKFKFSIEILPAATVDKHAYMHIPVRFIATNCHIHISYQGHLVELQRYRLPSKTHTYNMMIYEFAV